MSAERAGRDERFPNFAAVRPILEPVEYPAARIDASLRFASLREIDAIPAMHDRVPALARAVKIVLERLRKLPPSELAVLTNAPWEIGAGGKKPLLNLVAAVPDSELLSQFVLHKSLNGSRDAANGTGIVPAFHQV